MTRVQKKHSKKKKSAKSKTGLASIVNKMAPVCIGNGVYNFISADHTLVHRPNAKGLRAGVPFKHPIVPTIIDHCKESPNVYPKKFVDLLEKLKSTKDQHGFMLTYTNFGLDGSDPMVYIFSHDTVPELPNLRTFGELVLADYKQMGQITKDNMDSCIFYCSNVECVWPTPSCEPKVVKELWRVNAMAQQIDPIRNAIAPRVVVYQEK